MIFGYHLYLKKLKIHYTFKLTESLDPCDDTEDPSLPLEVLTELEPLFKGKLSLIQCL